MTARTKRKGNPDVDKDGYPGPIGRGKGKGKAKGKAKAKGRAKSSSVRDAELGLQEAIDEGMTDDRIEDARRHLAKVKASAKNKKPKAQESQALFYQRRAVDEAAGLVAANRDELEGLRKGKADKALIRQYEEELADSEHNLKIEKKALAEELAAEKIRSKQNPADAYLLEN